MLAAYRAILKFEVVELVHKIVHGEDAINLSGYVVVEANSWAITLKINALGQRRALPGAQYILYTVH